MNNNNRGNNNRRRGRGSNNRPQGGGGGQQLNRIDSRARGNAPQMHEKYRKMAQDAHLNGDRVTEEYYLQFADHYFRVIADQRARQDETRQPRGDRWQEGGNNDGDPNGEYGAEPEYPASPYYGEPRRDRDDAQRFDERDDGASANAGANSGNQSEPRREGRGEGRNNEGRNNDGRNNDGRNSEGRRARGGAPAEPRRDASDEDQAEVQNEAQSPQTDAQASPETGTDENPFEPAENPFTRGSRGLKPRRPRRDAAPAGDDDATDTDNAPAQLDLAALPPSIAVREETAEAAEPEAKPKRRAPRRKPAADDSGEPLQAAN